MGSSQPLWPPVVAPGLLLSPCTYCLSSQMPSVWPCLRDALAVHSPLSTAQMSQRGQGGIRGLSGLALLLNSLGRALGPASHTASLEVWGRPAERSLPFPPALPGLLLLSPSWAPESPAHTHRLLSKTRAAAGFCLSQQ